MNAYKAQLAKHDLRRIRVQDFVREMDLAYAAADVVISRSGALSVSEIMHCEKTCDSGAFAECCGRSSDKKRKGAGQKKTLQFW